MTIIHDIEDSSSLPPEVLSIIERFHRPLTPDLANVVREALSLGSFEIYQEALKSPLLSLDVDYIRWTKGSERPVTDIIDTTLSFVKKLRLVSSPAHIHRFGSRPTFGTWASFMTTLGFASSEDAFVTSGQFLLPRTVGSTQEIPTVFEGKASLLIAWPIYPKERAEYTIDTSDMQQEEPEDDVMDVMADSVQSGSSPKELEEINTEDEEVDSEGVEDPDEMEGHHELDDSVHAEEEYNDDEVVDSDNESADMEDDHEIDDSSLEDAEEEYHNDYNDDNVDTVSTKHDRVSLEIVEPSVSEDSQNIYEDVEAPDDGHILPGTGRRIHCLLPNVCVADKDNIQQLVTSVVYQRYAWGFFLPTIGIEIEGDGTTARVLIGWVDEENLQAVEELPSVHLAFSSNVQEPHPSRGVYDLLDPASTLHFAQFILWSGEYLSKIGESVKNAVPRDICWRLDHRQFDNSTMHPHRSVASQNYRDRVESWRSTAASELPHISAEGKWPEVGTAIYLQRNDGPSPHKCGVHRIRKV